MQYNAFQSLDWCMLQSVMHHVRSIVCTAQRSVSPFLSLFSLFPPLSLFLASHFLSSEVCPKKRPGEAGRPTQVVANRFALALPNVSVHAYLVRFSPDIPPERPMDRAAVVAHFRTQLRQCFGWYVYDSPFLLSIIQLQNAIRLSDNSEDFKYQVRPSLFLSLPLFLSLLHFSCLRLLRSFSFSFSCFFLTLSPSLSFLLTRFPSLSFHLLAFIAFVLVASLALSG